MNKLKYIFMLPLMAALSLTAFSNPTYADSKCEVVTGTGTNIGDEVSCSGEHFYVIGKTDKGIQLLAKYNLNTGITIHRENYVAKDGEDQKTTCQKLATEKGGQLKWDGFYTQPQYCFYSTPSTGDIIQNKDAKSAHWDKDGNYLYPQVGDTYIPEESYNSTRAEWRTPSNHIYGNRFEDFTINKDAINGPGDNSILSSLVTYENYLKDKGHAVTDINLLPVSTINELSKLSSKKELPLEKWSNDYDIAGKSQNTNAPSVQIYKIEFGDLKEYLSQKFPWIYSTTYWTATTFEDEGGSLPGEGQTFGNHYFVFVAEQGKLCGAGFEFCAPTTTLGTGVRPVVTIDPKDIDVKTTTPTSPTNSQKTNNPQTTDQTIVTAALLAISVVTISALCALSTKLRR